MAATGDPVDMSRCKLSDTDKATGFHTYSSEFLTLVNNSSAHIIRSFAASLIITLATPPIFPEQFRTNFEIWTFHYVFAPFKITYMFGHLVQPV